MSNKDISVDDLVQKDEFQALKSEIENLRDEMPEGAELPDEEIDRRVETKTKAMLDHLANEECDTDGCKHLRDQFGLSPGETPDDEETEETEQTDDEADEDDDDNDSDESDESNDGDSGTGGDDGGSEGSDSGFADWVGKE